MKLNFARRIIQRLKVSRVPRKSVFAVCYTPCWIDCNSLASTASKKTESETANNWMSSWTDSRKHSQWGRSVAVSVRRTAKRWQERVIDWR